MPRRYPIVYHARYVGYVEGRILNINRSLTGIYARCPCKHHDRCPVFTISTEILARAARLGADQVDITVTGLERPILFSIPIKKFFDGITLRDDKGMVQYGVYLHDVGASSELIDLVKRMVDAKPRPRDTDISRWLQA